MRSAIKIICLHLVGILFPHIRTFASGGRDSSVIVMTGTRDGQPMNSISTYRKGERFVSLSKSSDRP